MDERRSRRYLSGRLLSRAAMVRVEELLVDSMTALAESFTAWHRSLVAGTGAGAGGAGAGLLVRAVYMDVTRLCRKACFAASSTNVSAAAASFTKSHTSDAALGLDGGPGREGALRL